jgi:hypothetical protein
MGRAAVALPSAMRLVGRTCDGTTGDAPSSSSGVSAAMTLARMTPGLMLAKSGPACAAEALMVSRRPWPSFWATANFADSAG